MIKIDLITGFLGAGKTTFIKKYVTYLYNQGLKIGIIENDFGAVNVDMMLLQDISDKCDIEMIIDDNDRQTYVRRLRTKLIAMKMLGYDRIIIEPSGIYDIDNFFDVLSDDPLNNWYEIGSIIAIVDSTTNFNLSKDSRYILANEIANAGTIIYSKSDKASNQDIIDTTKFINDILLESKCDYDLDNIMYSNNLNFKQIITNKYRTTNYLKKSLPINNYQSLYYLNINDNINILKDKMDKIFNDEKCGNIIRIKGFVCNDNKWYQINATKDQILINEIDEGQEIIIVIGESLDNQIIEQYLY